MTRAALLFFSDFSQIRLRQLQHILIGRDVEDTFEMPVQVGQVGEAVVGHSGVDIPALLDGLLGMFNLAVQEELLG